MAAGNPFADLQPQAPPAATDTGNPFDSMASAPQSQAAPQDDGVFGAIKRGASAVMQDIKGLVPQAQNPYPGMGTNQKVQAAQQAVSDDDRRKAAGYSTAYRVVAPIAQSVGVNVDGMEDAAAKGDTAGVVGHTVVPVAGVAAGVAASHGAVGAVTDAVKDTAKKFYVPAETKASAAATAPAAADIHAQGASNLQSQVSPALDKVAQQAGVDTSGVSSLSEKAEVAGRAYRANAQKIYTQLDDAAQQATGQPGRFQDLTGNIRTIESAMQDPMLSPKDRAELGERLQNAQQQYDAFKKQMVAAGLDEGMIKRADKSWAQGAALDEVSRGFLTNEDASGNLKPGARPLDAPIKKFTAKASPRGHILQQALGDAAGDVADATTATSQSIASQKAAAKATTQAAKDAQQQINTVRSNQKKAALALGGAYALSKGKDAAVSIISGH